MAYQEEHTERQRMVVETPNQTTREVRTEVGPLSRQRAVSRCVTGCHRRRSSVTGSDHSAFFMYRQQDTANANLASQQPPQTTIGAATAQTTAGNCSAARQRTTQPAP